MAVFTTDPSASASIILHGCQVPRLLHNHHRILPRSNGCHLRRLLDRPLPAHRWQSQTHRGLLIPKEVRYTQCRPVFLSEFACEIEDGQDSYFESIKHGKRSSGYLAPHSGILRRFMACFKARYLFTHMEKVYCMDGGRGRRFLLNI
jgi:hypothetical protein